MVAQHVAAVCDPSVSILDLRNGTGEDMLKVYSQTARLLTAPTIQKKCFKEKAIYPRISQMELMHIVSETLKHQYLEVNRRGC